MSVQRIGFVSINRFNPHLSDGVSASLAQLLQYLRTRGHNPSIICLYTNEPFRRDIPNSLVDIPNHCDPSLYTNSIPMNLKGVKLSLSTISLPESKLFANYTLPLERLRQEINSHDLDYVITVENDLLSLFASTFSNLPGAHFFHSPSYIADCSDISLLSRLLAHKRRFSVSDLIKKRVKQLLGLDSNLWPPVFGPLNSSARQVGSFSKNLGYYSAGPHKGDAIVNAMIRKRPQWKFIVVGRHYRYDAQELPKNVDWIKDTTDMQSFYSSISLLLVPTLVEEGFPRVILEAAMAGIPTIGNAIPGVIEALGESGMACNLPLNSDNGFTEIVDWYLNQIGRLFIDRQFYESLREKALERASQYFNEHRSLSEINYHHMFDTTNI